MGLLGWALVFLVISLVAALFGFTGIAAGAAVIARVLFGIFLIIFLVLLLLALFGAAAVGGVEPEPAGVGGAERIGGPVMYVCAPAVEPGLGAEWGMGSV